MIDSLCAHCATLRHLCVLGITLVRRIRAAPVTVLDAVLPAARGCCCIGTHPMLRRSIIRTARMLLQFCGASCRWSRVCRWRRPFLRPFGNTRRLRVAPVVWRNGIRRPSRFNRNRINADAVRQISATERGNCDELPSRSVSAATVANSAELRLSFLKLYFYYNVLLAWMMRPKMHVVDKKKDELEHRIVQSALHKRPVLPAVCMKGVGVVKIANAMAPWEPSFACTDWITENIYY